NPVQQRVSAQERSCLIGECSMGRTAEERRQRYCQRPLKRRGKRAGTTQTAQGRASIGLRLRQEGHQPGSNRFRRRCLHTTCPGEQHLQSSNQSILGLPGQWYFVGTPQGLLQRALSGMSPEPRRDVEGLDDWCLWYGRHLDKACQCQSLVTL